MTNSEFQRQFNTLVEDTISLIKTMRTTDYLFLFETVSIENNLDSIQTDEVITEALRRYNQQ